MWRKLATCASSDVCDFDSNKSAESHVDEDLEEIGCGYCIKKCFNMVPLKREDGNVVIEDGKVVYVADRSQRVPVCEYCRVALRESTPKLPKCALANDLWIGKMPRCVPNLSTDGNRNRSIA